MATSTDRRRRENVFDLSRYLEQRIRVKFMGGREVVGVLKGSDIQLNMVLDSTTEFLRDPDDPTRITDDCRVLGLVVVRGNSLEHVCPADGTEPIQNPFAQQE